MPQADPGRLGPDLDKDPWLAFYEAARAEMVERIRLRDAALLAYVVFLGAYFGFALEPEMLPATGGNWHHAIQLVALPVVSLIFTLVVLQHHLLISHLAHYITMELLPAAGVRHWDAWCTAHSGEAKNVTRRSAQGLILIVPSFYALVRFVHAFRSGGDLVAMAAGAVVTIAIVFVMARWHFRVEGMRKRNQAERRAHCVQTPSADGP